MDGVFIVQLLDGGKALALMCVGYPVCRDSFNPLNYFQGIPIPATGIASGEW